MSFLNRSLDTLKRLREGEPKQVVRLDIPAANISPPLPAEPLAPDVHYFEVRVNEMYLSYGRKWFVDFDPMVFVVSEFIYDKKEQAVPFVVGPGLLDRFGQKLPAGMIFSDTRVAGIHPYRGGRVNLSVVLCRVKQNDHAQRILKLTESAASVIDFSTALTTYMKIAEVVLTGVESLLGLEDASPLIGFRKEFHESPGVQPGFFALIDMDEKDAVAENFWVVKNQLLFGKTLVEAKPFRQADYVLCSLVQADRRGDLSTLSYYPLYEHMVGLAMQAGSVAGEKATKAEMFALAQNLRFHPDLTVGQSAKLRDQYQTEMLAEIQKSIDNADLGPSHVAGGWEEDVKLLDS